MLDLGPAAPWREASAPLRGVTELMDWMASSYGKQYAPNTRETVRRFTLHQFVQMGLVLLNPDDPSRPTNSPKNVYRIEPGALALLRRYDTDEWEGALYVGDAGSKHLVHDERYMKKLGVEIDPPTSPWRKSPLHSPGVASRLASSLL